MSSPGAVNAHTHLYSGLAPLGMPQPAQPPRSFVELLEQVWWRLDRALDERSLRAAARLYVAEAVALGAAGLVDHHESPGFIEGSLDVLADACEEAGMPALLCYGATERNGGLEEARRGLEECRRFAVQNRRPGVRGLVGVHASFTVSDQALREAGALARELGTVLHLHVAEAASDVADARRRGYAGVVDRLERLGALVPGSILAHGVHLTSDEVATCARAGCWLVHNPRSNRGNQVGYAAALSGTERVALGTDGFPADMEAEQASLLEEAAAAGDALPKVAGRREAGARLLAERFGGALPDPAGLEARRRAAVEGLEQTRATARAEADTLWARMRAL